jgi:hypothetical protein
MSRARGATSSAVSPGRKRAVPRPKPSAPARAPGGEARRGRRRRPCRRASAAGRTARIALSPSGPHQEGGEDLEPVAPAASAAKHSVGVRTPGKLCSPSALGAADHGGVAVGRHDQAAAGVGDLLDARPRSGRCLRRSARVLAEGARHGADGGRAGSGELRGTSIRSMPASISASATGRPPRGRCRAGWRSGGGSCGGPRVAAVERGEARAGHGGAVGGFGGRRPAGAAPRRRRGDGRSEPMMATSRPSHQGGRPRVRRRSGGPRGGRWRRPGRARGGGRGRGS